MEGRRKWGRNALTLGLALALAVPLAGPMARLGSGQLGWGGIASVPQAQALQIKSGPWMRSADSRDATLAGLARKVDKALAAQNPKASSRKCVDKRTRTVTVTVSVHVKKAGMDKARSKGRGVYGSLVAKVRAKNLYRESTTDRVVADDWTVYGVNNYGKDNLRDESMRVGRAGNAIIDVGFVGCLWSYKGSFTRATRVREVYWNRSVRKTVCTVPVPKGYKLVLKMKCV